MVDFKASMRRLAERFLKHERGQIAIIFALSAAVLVTAIGGGIDLSRAFVSRQELSQAATLTCQYSVRPAIVSGAYNGGTGQADYVTAVNTYSGRALAGQNFRFAQTNAAPFTYVPGGSSSVSMASTVPTVFLGIAGIANLPISTTISCPNGEVQTTSTQGPLVISESFETAACSGVCWGVFSPTGTLAIGTTPTTSFPPRVGYTGQNGTQWVISGYCLEIDSAGITVATASDGSHVAELDCDNGSGNDGNSAISNKAYFSAGNYELRYEFQARVNYPNYNPIYICGSAAADTAWATDTNSALGTSLRTNQINVYFDADNAGSPGQHKTLDGVQDLAGVNMIDQCVYSSGWIERSVKITVTTPGYYWTTFAADGANDSFGGALDNIRLCRNVCTGTVRDNFPGAWPAKKLFQDTFDLPVYVQDPFTSSPHAKGGDLSNSLGTSGPLSGWPTQLPSGWGTAPYNEVRMLLSGAAQGTQYIILDGSNIFTASAGATGSSNYTTTANSLNRAVSRPFLLDPGYYRVDYNYGSEVDFAATGVLSGTYCTAAPNSGNIYPASYSAANGKQRFTGGVSSMNISTNILGVFMSHGSLVSTPTIFTPATANSLGAVTTFTNPDGSVTTTPATPTDTVNWASYNANVVNPVIDTCGYADSYRWIARTTYVKITKPGPYWLTFSANGGISEGKGPSVDDVRLTALNSLYGAAPSFSVVIPTPGPAPASTVSYTGFSIIADPNAP